MKYTVLAASLFLLAAAVPVISAQEPSYKRDVPASLAKRAKISEDSAIAIAKRRVPKGEIQSLELEREKGRLIYSFDMKVPDHTGVQEVNVSAISGKVIAVEHESAAAEAKEAAAESKETKKAPKKPEY